MYWSVSMLDYMLSIFIKLMRLVAFFCRSNNPWCYSEGFRGVSRSKPLAIVMTGAGLLYMLQLAEETSLRWGVLIHAVFLHS